MSFANSKASFRLVTLVGQLEDFDWDRKEGVLNISLSKIPPQKNWFGNTVPENWFGVLIQSQEISAMKKKATQQQCKLLILNNLKSFDTTI